MRILTFDGGGIRGILTAQLMARLEFERPGFLARAEFFAGTSIGSINAACFAKGLAPDEVVEFFKRFGPSIFKPRDWLDRLSSTDELVRANYDSQPLKDGLEEVLGADTTLGQLPHHIMIPAFDLECEVQADAVTMLGDLEREGATRRFRKSDLTKQTVKLWKPKYMHNFGDASNEDHAIKAVDACLRSSAAPTYFKSYQGHIDGGMMDNNPSMSALAKAVRATGQIREHALLSVGTGFNPHSIPGDENDWGYKQWLLGTTVDGQEVGRGALLDVLFDGQIGVPDYQVRQLLNGRYRRLDAVLPQVIDLADVDKIDELIEIANSIDLTSTVEWLDRNWMEPVAA